MFYTEIITDTQALFRYDTYPQAMEKYHNELGYAYNQGIHIVAIVQDSHGATMHHEEYTPAPAEPEGE